MAEPPLPFRRLWLRLYGIREATFASFTAVDDGRVHFGDQLYATVTKEMIEAARKNLVLGQA